MCQDDESASTDGASPVEQGEFDEMNLPEELVRGIHDHGFTMPTPIQRQVIQPILDGLDVVGQGRAGTGKTTAYLIAALARTNFSERACQTLVLVPTRELAKQTRAVACGLGEHLHVRCHACIGGTAWREDAKALRAGQHIVVGTPGRMVDMTQQGCLRVAHLKTVVLDVADVILSDSFSDQTFAILSGTIRPEVQVCLFSAALPPPIRELAGKFLRNPRQIRGDGEEDLTLEGLKQFHVELQREEWKLEVLCDLYSVLPISQCVVYRNSRRKADRLFKELVDRDFPAALMHTGTDQEKRDSILQEFYSGRSRVLICTEPLAAASRWQHVSLVMNYDVPETAEGYLQRTGRCGHFGRGGCVINLATERDVRTLRRIERHYATRIEELPADIADML